jgi:hypothetical protein
VNDGRRIQSWRIGLARRLVATTDRVFTFVTKQGVVSRWVRTRLFPVLAQMLFRLATVRRFLFPHGFADWRQLSQQPAERW